MNAHGAATNAENYARAALEAEARKVATAKSGERNAVLNTAAFSLGQLAGAGALTESEVRAVLERAACDCGLTRDDGARAVAATIKGAMAKGIASPREMPARNDDARGDRGRYRAAGASGRNYVACAPSEARTKPDSFPNWTPPGEDGKPTFQAWTENGPTKRGGEARRHVYKRGGVPVRVKIRNDDGDGPAFVDWYRVTNDRGEIGWQAKKPNDFRDVPYVGALDPFDRELEGDVFYWPEGEKDVDSVTRLGLPALTFGGVSALPQGAEEFCRGRHVVILADNDTDGRRHAEEKAAACAPLAASIKVVHFTELPPKNDVSNFLALGKNADDLRRRVEECPPWEGSKPKEVETTRKIERDVIRLNGRDRDDSSCNLPNIAESDVVRWHGKVPPEVDFTIDDFVPQGMTTTISSEGGAGKTLLMQTAATCVAAVIPFLGKATKGGAAAGIFAEDPDAVLHLRQTRLCNFLKLEMNSFAGRLFICSYCGADASLWVNERPTPFMEQLERQLATIPDLRLVTLDNSAPLFRGDENDRHEVTAFINALNGLADRLHVGILLSAHASKSFGGSALRVTSGSTAWVNASRSVLRLEPQTADNPPVLRLVKANHARVGVEVLLQWQEALLIPQHQEGGILGAIKRRGAEEVFLDLLDAVTGEGRPVSDSKHASNFAPKLFSSRPRREGYSARDFLRAMEHLFTNGRIVTQEYGRADQGRRRIIRAKSEVGRTMISTRMIKPVCAVPRGSANPLIFLDARFCAVFLRGCARFRKTLDVWLMHGLCARSPHTPRRCLRRLGSGAPALSARLR